MAHADAALLEAFTEAATGLLVPSEQDAPLEPLRWTVRGRLTPAQLLKRLSLPPDTPVEVGTLERFFAPLTRVRDAGDAEAVAQAERFAALHRLLATQLANPVVYRVGMIAITILIIGKAASGAILGLRTTVVET